MVQKNLYDMVHPKDIPMIKKQLTAIVSNTKKGEAADINSTPDLKETVENSGILCPGAKRSFLCRMNSGVKVKSGNTFEKTGEATGNVPEVDNYILSKFYKSDMNIVYTIIL